MVVMSQTCGAEKEPLPPGTEPSAAFTPGPWSIDEAEGPILYDGMLRPVWNVHGGKGLTGRLVASVEDFPDDSWPNANARLIAAAPDLLTTSKAWIDYLDAADWLAENAHITESRLLAAMRAAIAKALGPSAHDTSSATDPLRDADT